MLFEMFSWPQPSRGFGTSNSPISSAPLTSIALIKSEFGDVRPTSSLRNCRAIAEAPATTGVAIEDPLRVMYSGVVPSVCIDSEQLPPLVLPASWALAEQILTPGATNSGFIRPSEVGPDGDSLETCPGDSEPNAPVVEAPTVREFFAVLGDETPESDIFPDEKITNISG